MPYAPLAGSSAVNSRRNVSTRTTTTASTTAVAIATAQTARTGLDINNQSTATLYVRFAAVASPASATVFDVIIPPNTIYECPTLPPESAINGVWSAVSGSCTVVSWTEN